MRRSLGRRRHLLDQSGARDRGLHAGPSLPYSPVSEGQADRLIEAALELLRETGVRFEPGTEADELLANAGCTVQDDGVVRIPPEVSRAALTSCAKSVRLWSRDGTRCLEIDDRHAWFFPGMTCIKVYDLETGEPRDSTREDLALITRIADGLPNIDGMCVACKDVANSNLFGEIGEFTSMAANTTKPLEYLCEYSKSLEAAIAMASAIRGSREALAEKPYFLHIITPLPVNFARTHIEQIIIAARTGVPASVGTLAIGGASSPITIAGCLVHCLATDFAAMVLGQLAKPGAFCVGSSNGYFMEAATGGIGSNTQLMLGEQLVCQARRRLGLPSFTGVGGEAKSRRFNQDAVWEISTLMTQQFFTRPATCDYLGSLDQGITFSLHALLLCDDMAGMLRTLWKGAILDDEHLALAVVREVGPFGNFLGHVHTASHCRSANWASAYFGANEPVRTSGKPDRDLYARIDTDLRERLASPPPEPLSAGLLAELDDIQLCYSRELA